MPEFDLLLAIQNAKARPIDLASVNDQFRWGRIVPHPAFQHARRFRCYSMGDSHGIYNGFLGPPPELTRPRKRGKRSPTAAPKRDELRIAGVAVERSQIAHYLAAICESGDIYLLLWSHSFDTAPDMDTLRSSNAPSYSVDEAVALWPSLMAIPDRRFVAVRKSTAGQENNR